MKKPHEIFLKTLFYPGETFNMCGYLWQTTSVGTLEEALSLEAPMSFCSINPLKDRREDANVTAYRNFLLEFDRGTIEEQLEEIWSKGLPYATLTFSGGKSIHAVVALNTPLKTEEEYRSVFKLLRYVFWNTDPTTGNPSRLTRVAGAIRAENGLEQALVDIRRSVGIGELHQWLSRFKKHIARCEEREAAARRTAQERKAAAGSGLEGLRPDTKAFLEGDVPSYVTSRHRRLLLAAYEMLELGIDYDTAFQMISDAADKVGITDDRKRVDEPIKIVDYVYLGK